MHSGIVCRFDSSPERVGLFLRALQGTSRVHVRVAPDMPPKAMQFITSQKDCCGSLGHFDHRTGKWQSHVEVSFADPLPLSAQETLDGIETFFSFWSGLLERGEGDSEFWRDIGLSVCAQATDPSSLCCDNNHCATCNSFASRAAEHGIYDV